MIGNGTYKSKISFMDFNYLFNRGGCDEQGRLGARGEDLADEAARVFCQMPEFAVAGQTEGGEKLVRVTTQFYPDLLVARYSIFYGEDKGYTELTAAEAGYSLDCPKDPASLVKLISDPNVIKAVVEKDRSGLEKAIEELNKELPRPVLKTDRFQKLYN